MSDFIDVRLKGHCGQICGFSVSQELAVDVQFGWSKLPNNQYRFTIDNIVSNILNPQALDYQDIQQRANRVLAEVYSQLERNITINSLTRSLRVPSADELFKDAPMDVLLVSPTQYCIRISRTFSYAQLAAVL